MEGEKDAKNVQVFVRVRPPNEREKKHGYKSCLDISPTERTVTVQTRPEPKKFTYDHVAGADSQQEEVFQKVGRPISEQCLSGYNGTIFAYGQTGSGKTYTIQGPSSAETSQRGVMPRVFEYLCAQMAREERKAGGRLKYLCRASFLEIYNERVYDLLDPNSDSLNMREDIRRGVFVDNITEETVENAEDALRVMNTGIVNRRVGETAMNRESSRSHSVYCLDIESTEKKDGLTSKKHSRFHLIDLAGSERQKSTEAAGARLKEASTINKSLSALGNVIMSLVAEARTGKPKHVHYRDSKLTFLLRDSLGGNSLTYIIACVSSSGDSFGETMSTLKFAQRAKLIKNKARINENQSGNVAVLTQENERLRTMLRQLQALQNANTRRMSLSFVAPLSPLTEDIFTPQKKPRSAGASEGGGLDGVSSETMERLIESTLEREKEWAEENEAMKASIKDFTELIKRHEQHVQSNKLIVKMRESTIKYLRKMLKNKNGVDVDEFTTHENEMLQEEIGELKSQLEHHPVILSKAMTITRLEADLNRAKKDNKPSNSSREYFELSKKVVKLQGEKKELQKTMGSPRRLLNALASPDRKKFESVELKKWEAEQGFEEQLAALRKEVTVANGEAIAAKDLLSDLEKEKEEFEMRIKAAELCVDEHRANNEAMVLRHEMELTRLAETSLEQERLMKESYEQTLVQFEQGLKEVESHQDTQRSELSLELAGVKAKLLHMEAENKDLTARFNGSDTKVASLTHQLSASQETAENASLAAQQLANKVEAEVAKLRDELTAARAKAEDSEQQVEQARANISELKGEMERTRATSKRAIEEKFDTYQQLSQANSEVDRLTQLAEQNDKQIDRLTFNNEMMQEDHETVLESCNYLQTNNDQLKDQVATMTKQLSTLQQALETETRKTTEACAAAAQAREELSADADNAIAGLAAERDELLGVNSEHEDTINNLSNSLDEANERLEEAKLELKSAQEEQLATVNDFEQLSATYRALQAKNATTEKSLESAHCDLEASSATEISLRRTVEARDCRIARMKDEIVEMEQMEALAVDIHRHEIENLTKKMTHTAHRVREVEGQLDWAHSQLETREAEYNEARLMHEEDLTSMTMLHQQGMTQVASTLKMLREDHEAELLTWEARLVSEVESKAQQREISKQLRQALSDANTNYATLREEHGLLAQRSKSARQVLGEFRQTALDLLNSGEEGEAKGKEMLQIVQAVQAKSIASPEAEDYDDTEHVVSGMLEARLCDQKEIARLEVQCVNTRVEIKRVNAEMEEMRVGFREKEDTFARLSSDWQDVQKAKTAEVENLKAQVQTLADAISNLTTASNALVQENSVLNTQLQQRRNEHEAEVGTLQKKLQSTQSLLESHAQDADVQTFEAARLAAQVKNLNEKLRASLEDKERLSKDMSQYKEEEERTHREKEECRRLLSEVTCERDTLKTTASEAEKETGKLRQQISKLIGHQNPKQKIQHHMKIKRENDSLKTDKLALERDVRTLQRRLKTAGLEHALTDKENTDLASLEKAQMAQKLAIEQSKQLAQAILSFGSSEFTQEAGPLTTKSHFNNESEQATEGPNVKGALEAFAQIKLQFEAEKSSVQAFERQLMEAQRELKLLQDMNKLAQERKLLDSLGGMVDADTTQDDGGFVDGTAMFA